MGKLFKRVAEIMTLFYDCFTSKDVTGCGAAPGCLECPFKKEREEYFMILLANRYLFVEGPIVFEKYLRPDVLEFMLERKVAIEVAKYGHPIGRWPTQQSKDDYYRRHPP